MTDLEAQLRESVPEADLETASPRMKAALELIARAARSEASVLLRGENGTGKGVLARALGTDLQPIGMDAIVVTTQPNQQLNFRAVGTPAAAYVVWQDDRQVAR